MRDEFSWDISLTQARLLILSIACCVVLAACQREHPPAVQSADSGKTPLMVAVANGDAVSVRRLLESGAHVNDADADGYTALHRASHCGDIHIVKALIAAGADVN